MEDLSAMDWLCCDLCEIKDSKGKKQDYLVVVGRYSSFMRAYKLGSTKTKNVIKSLEEFIENYYGPPLDENWTKRTSVECLDCIVEYM